VGTSVNVSSDTFETDVVQASFHKPVLIDFFAQWCGPCQILKPTLEAIAREYDIVLAKVDIDASPDLASTYQVEGVPDVRLAVKGQVFPGFVGVAPEAQLRELMTKLGLQSDLEQQLAQVKTVWEAGDRAQAEALISQVLDVYGDNVKVKLAIAELCLHSQEWQNAQEILVDIPESDRQYGAKAKALRDLIQLQQAAQTPTDQNALDTRFSNAVQAILTGHYEQSLEMLLELVVENRRYREDAARKAMLIVFGVLGDDHPLSKDYRKRLMLALY
jgi:putative thioredoxin